MTAPTTSERIKALAEYHERGLDAYDCIVIDEIIPRAVDMAICECERDDIDNES